MAAVTSLDFEVGHEYFPLTFKLSKALGGYCKGTNDKKTQNECFPTGAFLNVESGIEVCLGGFMEGLLTNANTIFDEKVGTKADNETSHLATVGINGNCFKPASEESGGSAGKQSFAVFFRGGDTPTAVAFRMRQPKYAIFGMPLSSSMFMEYNLFSDTEHERRRKTIMRMNKVPFCAETVKDCTKWKKYVNYKNGGDVWNGMAEICVDRLKELTDFSKWSEETVRWNDCHYC